MDVLSQRFLVLASQCCETQAVPPRSKQAILSRSTSGGVAQDGELNRSGPSVIPVFVKQKEMRSDLLSNIRFPYCISCSKKGE